MIFCYCIAIMGNIEAPGGYTEPSPILPRVSRNDLLELILPEILDPNHTDRYALFALEQTELAKESRNRLTTSIFNPELRKIAIDEVSYVYQALRHALESSGQVVTPYNEVDTPLFDIAQLTATPVPAA